jgi:hypothetical protein
MNVPVNITLDGKIVNSLNMKWEWSWLPNGDPADARLQEYYSLLKFRHNYTIIWPSSVPSKMRLSLAQDYFDPENVDSNWIIVGYRYQEPYIFQVLLILLINFSYTIKTEKKSFHIILWI